MDHEAGQDDNESVLEYAARGHAFGEYFRNGHRRQNGPPPSPGPPDTWSERITELAEGMRFILEFCWRRPGDARAAGRRFAAVSGLMRPDLTGLTRSAIARQLRLTKGGVGYLVSRFTREAGVHFRTQRMTSTGLRIAAAQRRLVAEGRHSSQVRKDRRS